MADTQNRSVVGVHYRVGRKIGEGSFGVIFEGAYRYPAVTVNTSLMSTLKGPICSIRRRSPSNLCVRVDLPHFSALDRRPSRSLESLMHPSFVTSVDPIGSWQDVVSVVYYL